MKIVNDPAIDLLLLLLTCPCPSDNFRTCFSIPVLQLSKLESKIHIVHYTYLTTYNLWSVMHELSLLFN